MRQSRPAPHDDPDQNQRADAFLQDDGPALGAAVIASLPQVHRRILTRLAELSQSEKLILMNWREAKVNCSSCSLSCGTRVKWDYSSEVKCCTFQPAWANFMVGEWLANSDKAAADNLLAQHSQIMAVPLGILPSPDFQMRFASSSHGQRFGTDTSLRCTHLQLSARSEQQNTADKARPTASCAIWSQRPGTCASFFCQSTAGALGLQQLAHLEKLLNYIELNLAYACLLELGFTGRELQTNLHLWPALGAQSAELAGRDLDLLWYEFKEQKLSFYVRCSELIRAWSADELIRRLGDDLNLLYRSLMVALKPTKDF